MNNLERDLRNNARERLQQWGGDTIMRCQAMDLSDRQAAAIILSCLINELITGLLTLEMSMQDFMIIMQDAYSRRKRQRQRDSA